MILWSLFNSERNAWTQAYFEFYCATDGALEEEKARIVKTILDATGYRNWLAVLEVDKMFTKEILFMYLNLLP